MTNKLPNRFQISDNLLTITEAFEQNGWFGIKLSDLTQTQHIQVKLCDIPGRIVHQLVQISGTKETSRDRPYYRRKFEGQPGCPTELGFFLDSVINPDPFFVAVYSKGELNPTQPHDKLRKLKVYLLKRIDEKKLEKWLPLVFLSKTIEGITKTIHELVSTRKCEPQMILEIMGEDFCDDCKEALQNLQKAAKRDCLQIVESLKKTTQTTEEKLKQLKASNE